MRVLSVRDLRTSYTLAEETETKWAEQRNSTSGMGSELNRVETQWPVLPHVEALGFIAWLIMKLHSDQAHSEERIGGSQRFTQTYAQLSKIFGVWGGSIVILCKP
ncbi:hypothetical protein F4776DRAFT_604561 [Hypoxylon sp. NC0597]|nr:hypothetical protein F4776DRAFT_604561 [Hypoxylon sp. NC0597]